MHEILSDRFVDLQARSVADPEGTQEITVPLHEHDTIGPARADSFLDLLGELGRYPLSNDRGEVIADYRAWIGRNSVASTALYAVWFNLGVELAGQGIRLAPSLPTGLFSRSDQASIRPLLISAP